MLVTNLSNSRIYLSDLRLIRESQTTGRRGEDSYLAGGASIYLPDTSEVVRSAQKGDLRKFADAGIVSLNTAVALAAFPGPGNALEIIHNLRFLPLVAVVKQVGNTWVDATGTFDLIHDEDFTTTTITNTTGVPLTIMARIS